MEETNNEKKTWETPEIEIINAKITSGGPESQAMESASYYDGYAS